MLAGTILCFITCITGKWMGALIPRERLLTKKKTSVTRCVQTAHLFITSVPRHDTHLKTGKNIAVVI